MVTDLLERIETVGEGDMENVPRLPGTGPAYISHDGAETLRAGAAGIARGGGEGGVRDYQDTVKAGKEGGGGGGKMPPASEEYVKGTTWVFDDGSQVILRADGEGKGGAGGEGGGGPEGKEGGKGGGRGGVRADDDDFYDDFEKLTKGENFKDGDT